MYDNPNAYTQAVSLAGQAGREIAKGARGAGGQGRQGFVCLVTLSFFMGGRLHSIHSGNIVGRVKCH